VIGGREKAHDDVVDFVSGHCGRLCSLSGTWVGMKKGAVDVLMCGRAKTRSLFAR
jgi:hypothetical protein